MFFSNSPLMFILYILVIETATKSRNIYEKAWQENSHN